jgi:KUP system potassium uptake protein
LSQIAVDAVTRRKNAARLSALGVSALGVVFGDIGTSPLYTLKTVLGLAGGTPDAATTLGVLSLLIWTLIVITTIKYVFLAMRVDNDGEGGILALMSLLGVKRQHRPTIIAVGLFGAAVIYGDGAITPAISVPFGVGRAGDRASGLCPVCASARGPDPGRAVRRSAARNRAYRQGIRSDHGAMVRGDRAARDPGHFPAPFRAYRYRSALRAELSDLRGSMGFLVLGGVFLCVTGAEALYADMGHFGAR